MLKCQARLLQQERQTGKRRKEEKYEKFSGSTMYMIGHFVYHTCM